jgi:hypothetical protein
MAKAQRAFYHKDTKARNYTKRKKELRVEE